MLTKLPVMMSAFEELQDPRASGGNKQHDLFEMIFITLCATICGADSWTDVERFGWQKYDWLCEHLELENEIPSHDTLGRVFAALDTNLFATCIQKWIEQLELDLKGKGIHIDGKSLRRSFDTATGGRALQMVSAWADELSVCIGQQAVAEDSNEITAVPLLLDLMSIRGAVVSIDAMHCQKETLAKIRDKQADYVVTVKGNQEQLLDAIEAEFLKHGEENYQSKKVRSHTTTVKSRGRITERTISVASAPRALKESGQWADIKTIGMVYRHRKASNDTQSKPIQVSDHVTYFISSLPPKVSDIKRHVDKHWTVENSLHWTLDVTFSEDDSRIRKGNGQTIIACFRRLALSMLKRDTSLGKESIRGKRLMAGWDNDSLKAIIAQT